MAQNPENIQAAPPFRAVKCPLCKRASTSRYRPFCSKRCADIDLARWLKGTYAIPGHEVIYGEPEQGE